MMKRNQILIITMILFLVLAGAAYYLISPMESDLRQVDKETLNLNVTPLNKENLISNIELYAKPDGSYFKAVDEMNNKVDIYSTYFAVAIQKLIDESTDHIDSQVDYYLKEIESKPEQYLFTEAFNNLANIYYYVKLLEENDRVTTHKKEIVDYVNSLKYDRGNYAISKQMLLSDKDFGGLSITSTAMALEILKYYDELPDDTAGLEKWLEDCFNDKEIIDRKQILKAGYIIRLAEITKALNINKYNDVIKEMTLNYNDMLSSQLDSTKEFNLSQFSSVYELNKFLGTDSKKISNDRVKNMIYSLQTEDGMFKNGNDGEGEEDRGYDIQLSYIAINFLHDNKYAIKNSELLESYIELFKVKNKGYVSIGALSNNTSNSLYTIKVLNMLTKENPHEYQFLQTIKLEDIKTSEDLFYYIETSGQYSPQTLENNKAAISEYINGKLKASIKLGNLNDFNDTYFYLKCLQQIQYDLNEDVKADLLNNLNKSAKLKLSMDENLEFLVSSFRVRIFDALDISDNKLLKKDLKYLNKVTNDLSWISEDSNIYIVYNLIDSLEKCDMEVPDKGYFIDYVLSFKSPNEKFYFGRNSQYPSMKATYYALMTLKELGHTF